MVKKEVEKLLKKVQKPARYTGGELNSVVKNKEDACQRRRHSFVFWVRKIPWRRKKQPNLIFLPGKSHGQRSLVGSSPWGCKELDMTEVT